jgi:hypothetical protein
MPTPPCLVDRATSILPEIAEPLAREAAVAQVIDAQLALGNLDGTNDVVVRLAASIRGDAAIALWSKLAQAAVAANRSDLAQGAVSEAAAVVAGLSAHPGKQFHALSSMADAQIAMGDRSGAASTLTDLRNAMRQLSDVPLDDYVELARKQVRVGDDAGAAATVIMLQGNSDYLLSGITVELAEAGRLDDARGSCC